ncbi:DUF3888 domain-containing protein [Ammoniphilus sp. 3BR4]|uniref:DUF3888 domain-containing protein n=1 Tax=Ammoniphilus sp. 3BR4 TaxID=3158265 RepID=UPI0034677857
MKNYVVLWFLIPLLMIFNSSVYSQTINETDTELCDAFKYALIRSLGEPIDRAIAEIYKDDEVAQEEGLTWATYDTEILKIKQLYGVGGLYEITLKVHPYYRAHITYGEDKIVVSSDGELIDYEHLKTYPKVDFN